MSECKPHQHEWEISYPIVGWGRDMTTPKGLFCDWPNCDARYELTTKHELSKRLAHEIDVTLEKLDGAMVVASATVKGELSEMAGQESIALGMQAGIKVAREIIDEYRRIAATKIQEGSE